MGKFSFLESNQSEPPLPSQEHDGLRSEAYSASNQTFSQRPDDPRSIDLTTDILRSADEKIQNSKFIQIQVELEKMNQMRANQARQLQADVESLQQTDTAHFREPHLSALDQAIGSLALASIVSGNTNMPMKVGSGLVAAAVILFNRKDVPQSKTETQPNQG